MKWMLNVGLGGDGGDGGGGTLSARRRRQLRRQKIKWSWITSKSLTHYYYKNSQLNPAVLYSVLVFGIKHIFSFCTLKNDCDSRRWWWRHVAHCMAGWMADEIIINE